MRQNTIRSLIRSRMDRPRPEEVAARVPFTRRHMLPLHVKERAIIVPLVVANMEAVAMEGNWLHKMAAGAAEDLTEAAEELTGAAVVMQRVRVILTLLIWTLDEAATTDEELIEAAVVAGREVLEAEVAVGKGAVEGKEVTEAVVAVPDLPRSTSEEAIGVAPGVVVLDSLSSTSGRCASVGCLCNSSSLLGVSKRGSCRGKDIRPSWTMVRKIQVQVPVASSQPGVSSEPTRQSLSTLCINCLHLTSIRCASASHIWRKLASSPPSPIY